MRGGGAPLARNARARRPPTHPPNHSSIRGHGTLQVAGGWYTTIYQQGEASDVTVWNDESVAEAAARVCTVLWLDHWMCEPFALGMAERVNRGELGEEMKEELRVAVRAALPSSWADVTARLTQVMKQTRVSFGFARARFPACAGGT